MLNLFKQRSLTSSQRRYPQILLWALFVVVSIACFYTTFQWLDYKYSMAETYYSHGYLIPFVSAYLMYLKKDDLVSAQLGSNLWGLAVIVFSLMLHVFSVVSSINFISAFAMIFFLTGCSLFLLGNHLTKLIAFPLAYLVFLCPIPDSAINYIALPSKVMATKIALQIVDAIGIPFIQEGFRVHLVNSTYIVGTPCNGMRSLIAFLALGVLIVHFMSTSVWKKAVLLVAIPPLAVVLNGVRIAILLLVANKFGQEAASPESYLHDGSGLLVFVVGMIGMMIIYGLINEKKNN